MNGAPELLTGAPEVFSGALEPSTGVIRQTATSMPSAEVPDITPATMRDLRVKRDLWASYIRTSGDGRLGPYGASGRCAGVVYPPPVYFSPKVY